MDAMFQEPFGAFIADGFRVAGVEAALSKPTGAVAAPLFAGGRFALR